MTQVSQAFLAQIKVRVSRSMCATFVSGPDFKIAKRQDGPEVEFVSLRLKSFFLLNDSTLVNIPSGTEVVRQLLFTPDDVTLMGHPAELASTSLYLHFPRYLFTFFPSLAVRGRCLEKLDNVSYFWLT